ncbi:MAG: hypothetical protein GY811_17365 [Myxococcales bacterium]|nr:hypothetical protein [Myxococcales bacterium]
MSDVTPTFLNLDAHQILYWNFGGLAPSIPPQQQAPGLKIDLAQLILGHGVGWYPPRDPNGRFVIQVVREGEWETPVVRRSASSWDELRDELSKAIALARVAQLDRKS